MSVKSFINKGKSNENFHDAICAKFSTMYFDWKITVLFYSAIHYLKALGEKSGKPIGNTHYDIWKNVCPASKDKILHVPTKLWDTYQSLYQSSRTSRYDGFEDENIHNTIMKSDHQAAKKLLTTFKVYLRTEGLTIPNT